MTTLYLKGQHTPSASLKTLFSLFFFIIIIFVLSLQMFTIITHPGLSLGWGSEGFFKKLQSYSYPGNNPITNLDTVLLYCTIPLLYNI